MDIEGIFAATGWTARRFNPAIAAVAAQVPDGRVIRSGPPHGIAAMHLLTEDRVALKRYVARLT